MTKQTTLSHDTLEMANSYRYMCENFASFGVAVSNASRYAEMFLQSGTSSAIHSDNVGTKLKDVWDNHADSDFDNFIKNFDVWGAAMVEANNLAENYKEEAAAEYKRNNVDAGAPGTDPKSSGDIYGKGGFGDGHGYVSDEDIRRFRYENGISDKNYYQYLNADNFTAATSGLSKREYFERFDRLAPLQKAIVAQQNSRKAKDVYEKYASGGTSPAYFHILEQLNPGERAALDDLIKRKGAATK